MTARDIVAALQLGLCRRVSFLHLRKQFSSTTQYEGMRLVCLQIFLVFVGYLQRRQGLTVEQFGEPHVATFGLN